VKLALLELLAEPPDLIVSGLNAGSNSGINVLYSGTVAAATEGSFYGHTAIACSLEYDGKIHDFASGAKHDTQGWNADKRRKLGWECERSVSEIVASNEIARQWTRMLASIEGNTKAGSLDEPGLRTGLSKPWSQSWNRRELIRAILVSEAWLSTALDSLP
jgi:hypothetical protein